MMQWSRISKEHAKAITEEWEAYSAEDFLGIDQEWQINIPKKITLDYVQLRQKLLSLDAETDSIRRSLTNKERYPGDLHFGLGMYDYLCNVMGMDSSTASDDDVWRYIHIYVVPDLILKRWPSADDTKRVNEDRFWRDPRRMWLKTLWWYVHLSLQNGSVVKTKDILSLNSSDDINQLVERPGGGYRIELYRAIMKRYGMTTNHGNHLLRRVLKLNLIKCEVIEPLLLGEKIDEYVEELFRYFGA